MKCPYCGQWEIREGETFCQWCGGDLRELGDTPDPSPVPEPEPAPEPVPEPEPEPLPAPTPAPNPEPTPMPMPEPEPKPSPAQEPKPKTEPLPSPGPMPQPALPSPPSPRPAGISPYLVAVLAAVTTALVFGLFLLVLKPGQTVIVISLSDIEDESLRTYVSEVADTNGDGSISQEEADAVTEIDLSGIASSGRTVSSASGIGYFSNLKSFNCSNNAITSLDLSSNHSLEQVYCDNNSIEHIELPAGGTLTTIHAQNNPLTSIDLSQQTGLTDVKLDEGVEIIGAEAPSDELVREKIEDMALVYSTAAFAGTDGTSHALGEELVSQVGTSGIVDSRLVSNYLYPVYTPGAERVTANEYGVEYESTSDSSCIVSQEAIRSLLRSFYGSEPESLDYLVTDKLTANDSGSWTLMKENPAFDSYIFTGNWQAYGKLVTFDAAISQSDMMSDALWFKFRVIAVQDQDSIFGYHLVSMTLTEDMPALSPEALLSSTTGNQTEQVANMGLPFSSVNGNLYYYSSLSSAIHCMDSLTGQTPALVPIPSNCTVVDLTVANGRIYYILMDYGTTSQYERLISVRPDGTDERVLLSNQTPGGTDRAVYTALAALDNELYLQTIHYGTSTTEGYSELVAMDLDGNNTRTLCTLSQANARLALSTDDNLVYFASQAETYHSDERSAICAYDLSSGSSREVYRSEVGNISGLLLCGDRLVFKEENRDAGTQALASVKTDGTEYIRLLTAPNNTFVLEPTVCSGSIYTLCYSDDEPLPLSSVTLVRTPADSSDVSSTVLSLVLDNCSLGVADGRLVILNSGFDVGSTVTGLTLVEADGQSLKTILSYDMNPYYGSTSMDDSGTTETSSDGSHDDMIENILAWAESEQQR